MLSLKRILKRKEAQVMGAWVGAFWVRLVTRSTRWEIRIPDPARRIIESGESFIGVFWHGRMMMMPHAWTRRGRIHVLISEHRDGLLVSRLIARLGFPTLAGSTSKGGMTALRTMKRLLAAGDCIAITPDGPRGPRMRVKPGTIKIAQWSGRPILPATFSTTRREILGSWDHFCFARPFSRGVILIGEPVAVPRDADSAALEALRQCLEDRLNALTEKADRLCGHEPVEPAPPHKPAPGTPINDEFADYQDQAAASSA